MGRLAGFSPVTVANLGKILDLYCHQYEGENGDIGDENGDIWSVNV